MVRDVEGTSDDGVIYMCREDQALNLRDLERPR